MTIAAPHYVSWMCTRRCNLSCKHCYVGVVGPGDRRGELDTARALQLIDEIVASEAFLLSFGGAEPLVREDFFDLAAHAHDEGLTIVTSTNGILVDDDAVARLKEVGFKSLQISLDGASAEVHERLRGRGTFAPAVAAIERCRAAGLPVGLAVAVHSFNIDDLESIVALGQRLGVASIKIEPVLQPGHRLSGPVGGLSAAQGMDACHRAQRMLDGSGIRLAISAWAGLALRNRPEDTDCANAFKQALVFEDGSVGVCEGIPGVGSALDGHFLESWRVAVTRQAASRTCACTPFIERARQHRPHAA